MDDHVTAGAPPSSAALLDAALTSAAPAYTTDQIAGGGYHYPVRPTGARRAHHGGAGLDASGWFAGLVRVFVDARRRTAPAVRRLIEQTRSLCQQVAEEQPPGDPMGRALWLRQHRHTGPATRLRAPHRIDARRSRTGDGPAGCRHWHRR